MSSSAQDVIEAPASLVPAQSFLPSPRAFYFVVIIIIIIIYNYTFGFLAVPVCAQGLPLAGYEDDRVYRGTLAPDPFLCLTSAAHHFKTSSNSERSAASCTPGPGAQSLRARRPSFEPGERYPGAHRKSKGLWSRGTRLETLHHQLSLPIPPGRVLSLSFLFRNVGISGCGSSLHLERLPAAALPRLGDTPTPPAPPRPDPAPPRGRRG